MMDEYLINRFHNVIAIALITSFLVVPVAFLIANPDAIVIWSGQIMADYCLRTAYCDYAYLKAGLGVALFIMISLLIAFLEAFNFKEIGDTVVEERLSRIEETLSDFYMMYEMDNPEDDEDLAPLHNGNNKVQNRMRDMTFIFLLGFVLYLSINLVGYFPVEKPIPYYDIFITAVFLVVFLFMFGDHLIIIFKKDEDNRLLFWEKNDLIQGIYKKFGNKKEESC